MGNSDVRRRGAFRRLSGGRFRGRRLGWRQGTPRSLSCRRRRSYWRRRRHGRRLGLDHWRGGLGRRRIAVRTVLVNGFGRGVRRRRLRFVAGDGRRRLAPHGWHRRRLFVDRARGRHGLRGRLHRLSAFRCRLRGLLGNRGRCRFRDRRWRCCGYRSSGQRRWRQDRGRGRRLRRRYRPDCHVNDPGGDHRSGHESRYDLPVHARIPPKLVKRVTVRLRFPR